MRKVGIYVPPSDRTPPTSEQRPPSAPTPSQLPAEAAEKPREALDVSATKSAPSSPVASVPANQIAANRAVVFLAVLAGALVVVRLWLYWEAWAYANVPMRSLGPLRLLWGLAVLGTIVGLTAAFNRKGGRQ